MRGAGAANLQWIVTVITQNLVTANIVIAVVQIALGVLFLSGRWIRGIVIASIIWALIVWYGGEGMSLTPITTILVVTETNLGSDWWYGWYGKKEDKKREVSIMLTSLKIFAHNVER